MIEMNILGATSRYPCLLNGNALILTEEGGASTIYQRAK